MLTIITQSIVDRDDPRLENATKPIGHKLTADESARLEKRGEHISLDGGGRMRRKVPSPAPTGVVEAEAVKRLVDAGRIVVAAGGGGPPVYHDDRYGWEGIDAVVDKDSTAAVLGRHLGADILLILTDVDGVYEGWGTDSSHRLDKLSLVETERLLENGSLGEGSMKPKVRAALNFVRGGGQKAIIAELASGLEAVRGETGTTISRER